MLRKADQRALDRRGSGRIRHQRVGPHTRRGQRRPQQIRLPIVPGHSDRVHPRPHGDQIQTDVRRAARAILAPLHVQDRHGGLGAQSIGIPEHELIEHVIADDHGVERLPA